MFIIGIKTVICNLKGQPELTDLIKLDPLITQILVRMMTSRILNYESGGKNDDQQNKENQDKTNMTSKSDNCAHSYSLLSTKIPILYFFISEMLGQMPYLKV
jgi:hypothetical protein